MEIKTFNYPDRKFSDNTQLEIRKLKDFNIAIESNFAKFILIKAIDAWPRLANDIDRVRAKNHGYLHISMLFLPKLWFVNMLAIGSGYIMNYELQGNEILIIYSHH